MTDWLRTDAGWFGVDHFPSNPKNQPNPGEADAESGDDASSDASADDGEPKKAEASAAI